LIDNNQLLSMSIKLTNEAYLSYMRAGLT